MSSFVFNDIKRKLALGSFNFNTGQFKVALCVGVNRLIYGNKTVWSDLKTLEISNVANSTYNSENYSVKLLTNVGVIQPYIASNIKNSIVFSDNAEWLNSTIDANYAVIVKSAHVNPSTIEDSAELVMAIDIQNLGNKVSSNNGTFRLILDQVSGGFLTIK